MLVFRFHRAAAFLGSLWFHRQAAAGKPVLAAISIDFQVAAVAPQNQLENSEGHGSTYLLSQLKLKYDIVGFALWF